MNDVLARLRELTKHQASRLIVHVAKEAGRNPLEALGLPTDLVLLPEVALLLHELLNPPKNGQKSESELDAEAEASLKRMDRQDSWERAVKTGYTGPRGEHQPPVLPLHLPDPAPLTPALFPPANPTF